MSLFFSKTSRLPEHHKEMFNSSFKNYFSNLHAFHKFHHLQVPYGTKNANFCAISHGVGISNYQNIVDRCLRANIKDISHIYVFPVYSSFGYYVLFTFVTLDSGRKNFEGGSFDWKLKALVPFLREISDRRLTSPPPPTFHQMHSIKKLR